MKKHDVASEVNANIRDNSFNLQIKSLKNELNNVIQLENDYEKQLQEEEDVRNIRLRESQVRYDQLIKMLLFPLIYL